MKQYLSIAISDHKQLDERFLAKVKSSTFTTEDIQERLTKYSVIRNFKGEGSDRFSPIRDYLKEHGYKKEIDPVREVNNFILFIADQFGVISTSAASKLLWAFYPVQVVIYDANAVKTLRKLGHIGIENHYEFYYRSWFKEYSNHKMDITQYAAKAGFYGSEKKTISMRAFDKYLWDKGR